MAGGSRETNQVFAIKRLQSVEYKHFITQLLMNIFSDNNNSLCGQPYVEAAV